MKTIGILGGMSWESTADYYKIINEYTNMRLGNLSSAKIVMYSFNFEIIENLQHNNQWEKLGEILGEAAVKLEKSGADVIVIATNTMHKVADIVEKSITVPLLHIADVTSEEIIKDGIKKVLLLGTKFTMKEEFYKERMKRKYGIEIVVPQEADIDKIHEIIYKELCKGVVSELSKKEILRIIEKINFEEKIEGIILGCTELPMIIKKGDISLRVYNTTEIHSKYAVEKILEDE